MPKNYLFEDRLENLSKLANYTYILFTENFSSSLFDSIRIFEYHLHSPNKFFSKNTMNIKVKTIAVPAFVALSLLFGACADQTIESPDAVDGAATEGVEGIEQGAEDAGNAVDGGLNDLETGAEDAGNYVEDGAKNLQKGVEDAAGDVKNTVEDGLDDAGNAVDGLGN